ncbi:hypothetical protein RJT34_04339 [Clitoria ternatea]|uniref:Uncharacterized protein n=1 Tax=Clitoria ternatea TaxID=43366 RepID=A0AAN9KNB1_CLITE
MSRSVIHASVGWLFGFQLLHVDAVSSAAIIIICGSPHATFLSPVYRTAPDLSHAISLPFFYTKTITKRTSLPPFVNIFWFFEEGPFSLRVSRSLLQSSSIRETTV